MPNLDLRPLSLGEILDRTFTLYRRNFLLFAGITALPNLLVLALQVVDFLLLSGAQGEPGRGPAGPVGHAPATTPGPFAFGFLGFMISVMVIFIAYLLAQGATVFAVSDLYLGRSTSILSSLGKMPGVMLRLIGLTILNGLAVMGAAVFLIIPAFYVACRLIASLPAALLEGLGPLESLRRSFALTKGSAGRAFVIYLLYFVLIYAALLLFMMPFSMLAIFMGAKDPSMARVWLAFSQVGNFFASTLVTPVLTIATALFYYDLRVRKEAFDLEFMMNATGNLPSPAPGAQSFPS